MPFKPRPLLIIENKLKNGEDFDEHTLDRHTLFVTFIIEGMK